MRRDEPWAPGTPCWTDVLTNEPERSRDFYAGLFGWAFEPADGGWTARLDGRAVAGVVPREHAAVWNTYFAVADVDLAAAAVTAAGGVLEVPPVPVGTLGRTAVCLDPAGAAFGLWQAGDLVGCEVADEPGSLRWSELVSRDHAAATAFYVAVFGHGTWDVGTDEYPITVLRVDGREVANTEPMPPGLPHSVPSHWRTYFDSADVDTHATRCVELGGTVIESPHDSPFGRWASLADPLGARFSVITPPDGAPR
ncbi:VOC family protein [Jatrophihabitans fulvus]